jgi:hypothetical protein
MGLKTACFAHACKAKSWPAGHAIDPLALRQKSVVRSAYRLFAFLFNCACGVWQPKLIL